MRTFILIFIVILTSARIYATSQAPDILIYKGDTLLLQANPLELLKNFDSTPDRMFGPNAGLSTGCWRGYIATWIVSDDQLYLQKIESYNREKEADMSQLFGEKYTNGRVKADWVNDTLLVGMGKVVYYVHDEYATAYEREMDLFFTNGKLTGTCMYDNSRAKEVYFTGSDIAKYIYSNIRWNQLPDSSKAAVGVMFSADIEGHIDSVTVIRSYGEPYDQEAVRVIKSIPEWSVYIKRGKLRRMPYTIRILFTEENRLKYAS